MKEKQRIITVIIALILFNVAYQLFLRKQRGITVSSVLISLAITMLLYIALIYFFGKKHTN